MEKRIKFFFNSSEIGAGTRGASLGPESIRVAARKKGSKLFGSKKVEQLVHFNDHLDTVHKHAYAKHIDVLLNVYIEISKVIANALKNDVFPIVIAADHASAGGTIAGIKNAYPNKRLGVVWIDAHGDLHSPYTTPSGNMHGMPLTVALGDDNLPCKINSLDQDTISYWEKLKNIGLNGKKVLPEDLVFVAVRDTEAQEDAIIDRLGIQNFTVDKLRSSSAKTVAYNILNKLSDCDQIYVSFDVDSMDPDVTSYGTGTPVKNGLFPEEVIELLSVLMASDKIVCFELVEVNPCLDNEKNKMAETALEILEGVVATLEQNL
jgi:arginase